jgi:hypothetical protein
MRHNLCPTPAFLQHSSKRGAGDMVRYVSRKGSQFGSRAYFSHFSGRSDHQRRRFRKKIEGPSEDGDEITVLFRVKPEIIQSVPPSLMFCRCKRK